MKHIKTNWNTYDGLEIFAQSWEPDKNTAKAIVCFIHGIGDHSSRHAHVAKEFTDAGYVFFTGDLRGHGKSQGIKGHFPSEDAILRDIDLLISKATESYPGLPLILYGHSLGGIFVLYYALMQKPDIAGVISVSPGLHNAMQNKPLLVLAAKILGSLFPEKTISNNLDLNGISIDAEVVEAYKNDPLIHDRISLGLGKRMLSVNNRTMKNAADFPLPLLLMHGKADFLTFASGSIAFAEPLKDKCRLILWENAYHELHNEPQKAEIIGAMVGWSDALLLETLSN
ncbi:MAG: lysophospholipase [Lentimicrobium sp.]|nr:lysophospholipase [Lentimicrobium sp.]